jgi:hypothetical protein
MAKHVVLEGYTFTPASRSVVVNGKNIRREQLLLITNVTRNTVIYNFSDPNLGATSFVNAVTALNGGPGVGTPVESTTILLAYNTTSMNSTDKLAILVEETYAETTPAESQLDPVGKMRVSEPQSLIDTDFEYGTQPTKWESISLMNNRPTAFFINAPTPAIPPANGGIPGYPTTNWGAQPGQLNISNVFHSGGGNTQITVSIADTITPNIYVGQPIYVQGSLDSANADGWFVIEQVTGNVSFSYRALNIPVTNVPASVVGSNILYDPTKTYVFAGAFYSNSAITVNNVSVTGGVIYVNTTNAHGLTPGNHIMITNTSGVTGTGVLASTGLNGIWNVANTPTSNTLIANGFVGTTWSAGAATLNTAANTLYMRPAGYVQHRAFDGGVQFTNQLPAHNSQFVRQTRRYFRYQSGKGVQFSTGSIFRPSITPDNITSSGTTVTVTTKVPHGLGVGANITVSGVNETGYNGLWSVASVPSATAITYITNTTPSATTTTGFPQTVSPYSWYGSRNRLGMFDEQNGFFFEYDGQQVYCVKRSSTQQITGTVSANTGNVVVTGYNTKFGTQLQPGDMIVIRGTSYKIQSIESDTALNIFPEYRGTNVINSLVSKTIDTKYPQSSWNIDKLDGTGHSLFNLDPSKMQMWYMDFSWYGAGAIRFGVKNNRGEVVYCHRIANNNFNTEAYMRSGNMASRYETSTYAPYTILGATLASSATTGATITVADANSFPSSGTVIVTQPGNRNANIEYITYTAKSGNVLTIGNRAVAGGTTTASQFNYASNVPTQVSLYSPQVASTMSHWGSSVIMDGKYDDDKSLVFNIGQNNALANLPTNNRYAIMSLRIAPSVDSGITGLMGTREINNRMQLVLRQMDALTTQPYRIEVILNGTPAEGRWQSVGGSSLAQYILHANATPIVGGENMFSFFTNASGTTQQDMTLARDIGTSIIGGGTSLLANTFLGKYPDGPDMITICATNLAPAGVSANINARISWTEAQA